MAEQADAQDLKSCGVTTVPVRPRSSAPNPYSLNLNNSLMSRGRAARQLVGLITRRSWVQIPPPQPNVLKDLGLQDIHGGVAQLARALGSYPSGRWFESDRRYQNNYNLQGNLEIYFYICV